MARQQIDCRIFRIALDQGDQRRMVVGRGRIVRQTGQPQAGADQLRALRCLLVAQHRLRRLCSQAEMIRRPPFEAFGLLNRHGLV